MLPVNVDAAGNDAKWVYIFGITTIAVGFSSSLLETACLAPMVMLLANKARIRSRAALTALIPIATMLIGFAIIALLSGAGAKDMQPSKTAAFALKSYLCIVASFALASLASPIAVVNAMNNMRMPGIFTSIIAGIFRWCSELRRQAIELNTARLLRGGGCEKRYMRSKLALGMANSLMIRSYRRAETAALAMECRGFNGTLPRSVRGGAASSDIVHIIGVSAYCVLVLLVMK